jgi:translocator assembly and maintenance protein 41
MLSKGNIRPVFYRLLSKFPQNFSFCFAYGSGVKMQLGYEETEVAGQKTASRNLQKRNMIDLIYCVENPKRWHSQNIEKNPTHYSAIKVLGSDFISRYQENFGAKVFFNTLVPIEEEQIMIKYGVISTKDFITDLLDWKFLYVAGRLQKPVEIIKNPSSSKIQNALELNLQNAAHTALLLLPEKFTEYELYYTITSLSYIGDFRMIFGENKNKVENIVRPQIENFRSLYMPTLKLFKNFVTCPAEPIENGVFQQDTSPHIILHHLNQLPKWPLRNIVREWNRGKYRQDTEDVLRAISFSPDYQDIVRRSLVSIVWNSSIFQSLKNIPTAGFSKSIKYSIAKVKKQFNK